IEDKKDDKKDDDKDSDKKDDDKNDATYMVNDATKAPSNLGEDDKVVINASDVPDLTTKEGRAMHRAKIAQKGIQFSDMLQQAHPKGGHSPEGFDTKPSSDLSKVERIDEVSKAMNDLANMPPKVRKQA